MGQSVTSMYLGGDKINKIYSKLKWRPNHDISLRCTRDKADKSEKSSNKKWWTPCNFSIFVRWEGTCQPRVKHQNRPNWVGLRDQIIKSHIPRRKVFRFFFCLSFLFLVHMLNLSVLFILASNIFYAIFDKFY